MSPVMVGILGLIIFIVLMFIGIPIPFAMLFGGAIGMSIILSPANAAQMITNDILSYFSNYTLTVGPLFGLMGFFALYSGIGAQLFGAVNSLMGHKPGGLAMATQVACAGFGAICGSVPACISTMSAIAYPEMRKRNYSPAIAGPCVGAGACLSVLIPPSSSFIIYGLATETSIGALFIAGIVPGVIMTIINCCVIYVVAKRHPDRAPQSEKATWAERWQKIRDGGIIEVAIVFIISMGGMMAGFFTATEAGAVGAFGMFIVTLVTKKMDMKRFVQALVASVRLQAMVFLLLACAVVFGKLFSVATIPAVLGRFVRSLNVPGWGLLLAILIIYFLLGMVTDLLSMTLVTMPIFFPIVCDYLGYSPLWFGVVITVMIAIAGLTPPMGSGVFLVKGCVSWDKEATLGVLFGGVWPFVIANAIVILVLILYPPFVDFLPNLLHA